jgi:acyl-CoA synthetase (AMP-forming)/AMP-acid ligase II
MDSTVLLHELIGASAQRDPAARALTYGAESLSYGELDRDIRQFAAAMRVLGVRRAERIGIYLEKRFETVVASFGAAAAGAVFVPLNPLLKAEQVGYIMRDCNVRVLVTSPERLALLAPVLAECPDLRHVLLVGADPLPAAGGGPALHP